MSILIPVVASPIGIAINEITNRIYVTNSTVGRISVINGASTNVTDTIPVGTTPEHIAVNKVTNRIYVVNVGSSNISVIDGATNTEIDLITIPFGATAEDIAVNEITNRIYVSNSVSGAVSVIDGTTNMITATVFIQPDLFGLAVNEKTNLIYVTNTFNNVVTVIDGATNTEIFPPVSVGRMPKGIAVNEITNKIYVSNSDSNFGNSVSVIDGVTDTVIITIPVGTTPLGIAVNEITNTIYVANSGDGNVSVIDGGTDTVTETIPAGLGASDVVVNETTSILYVANTFVNTISVINVGLPQPKNKFEGLAQGSIDHKASSIINSVCGDASLKIGDVVKILPVGTGNGFTQLEDLLPRVGVTGLGEPAYGIIVGGDFEGIYGDGAIPINFDNLAVGIIVSFFGEGVRVCTSGRCLALVSGPISVGDKLTSSPVGLVNANGGNIIATALQTAADLNSIIAVDIKREGFIPGGGLLYYDAIITGPAVPDVMVRTDLNGGHLIVLPISSVSLAGVAVDSTSLYVTDSIKNLTFKAELDGTNPIIIPASPEPNLGIAVNSTSLYSVDSVLIEVIKSDLDGTNGITLPITGLAAVRDIAINSTSLYVSDETNLKIVKTDLDGTNQVDLPTTFVSNAGIAADSESIYITEIESAKVIKADLDGTNPVDIPLIISFPFDIAVSSTSFYTGSVGSTLPLIKANLDGTNQVALPIPDNTQALFGIGLFEIKKPIPDNWFNTSFKRRVLITINENQVPTTQTNFPFLFNSVLEDLSNAQSLGEDIRFALPDKTELKVEVENIETTMGASNFLIAWTKVPNIKDGTEFFMYFANPNASLPPLADRQEVWSDYNLVYHMNQDPSGGGSFILDSTVNSNNAFTGGSTVVSADGEIGKAIGFNRPSFQFLEMDTEPTYVKAADLTISTWVKITDLSSAQTPFGAGIVRVTNVDPQPQGDFNFTYLPDGQVFFYHWKTVGNNLEGRFRTNTGVVTDNGTFYMVATFDDTADTAKIYINGVSQTLLAPIATA